MKNELLANYVVPLMTVTMAILVVIGTVYILRSMLLSAQLWGLDQEERLKIYIKYRFDVKWPWYFIGSFFLGIIISWLGYNWLLVKLNFIFIILFIFLWWGNINTFKLRKLILERISKKRGSAPLE